MQHAKMPLRTRAFLLCTIACILSAAYLLQPWADTAALVAIISIAPTSTLFALVYGFTVPWWETLIGRAMLASSTGLAMLVDITLLYQWLGDDYALRDMVRLSVFFTVSLGAAYKAAALVNGKLRERHDGRDRRLS